MGMIKKNLEHDSISHNRATPNLRLIL